MKKTITYTTETESEIHCPYCGASCRRAMRRLRHPQWTDMPPVDIYECYRCCSYTTSPMPSHELLKSIYQGLETGYPEHKSQAKKETLQTEWYNDILKTFSVYHLTNERIADIGAGEGWLASAILERMGTHTFLDCFDLHEAPQVIRDNPAFGVNFLWVQADAQSIQREAGHGGGYDRIFLISVIEHVPDPKQLVENCLEMLRNSGVLHVLGPLITPLARLLGRRWPYLIPGEHLTIPTIEGLEQMAGALKAQMEVKKMPVTYSLKYVTKAVLGITIPGFLDVAIRLPLGAFAATFRKRST